MSREWCHNFMEAFHLIPSDSMYEHQQPWEYQYDGNSSFSCESFDPNLTIKQEEIDCMDVKEQTMCLRNMYESYTVRRPREVEVVDLVDSEDEEKPKVQEVRRKEPGISEDVIKKVIEDQVEKCKKFLEPILTELIRSGIQNLQSSVVGKPQTDKQAEVIELSGDESSQSEMLQTEPLKTQNRRFKKTPVRNKPVERRKTEDINKKVKKGQKNGLKIRFHKKSNEWVVENMTLTPRSKELYVCDVCDFYDCDTLQCLKRHQLTHREAKAMCRVCHKRFFTIGDLKTHEATHSKRECEICGGSFGEKQLVQHMRRHFPPDARLQCVHCNKSYVRRYDLERHVTRKHLGCSTPAKSAPVSFQLHSFELQKDQSGDVQSK